MNSIWNIKELGRAFWHHALKPRSFPLVLMFVLLVIPCLLFIGSFLWDLINQAILGSAPGPIAQPSPYILYEMIAVTVSAVFTARFVHRTTRMANQFCAWLETRSHRVKPGSHPRSEWLLAEVDAQRTDMGISAMPEVILFDPREVRIGSAFAHIGLAGRGIVAFPFEWLDMSEDDAATRGVIGHELTHIRNRDVLIRQIAATALDVFVHIPFQAALAFFLMLAGFSAVVVPLLSLAFVIQTIDSGSFRVWVPFGAGVVRLLTSPQFGHAIGFMMAFTGLGFAIQTYACWVARAQEADADENAGIVAGLSALEKTILMLVEIEQAEPAAMPLTDKERKDFAKELVRESLWFLDFSSEGVQSYASIMARIVDKLLRVSPRIPGIPKLARWVMTLWRQHPPTPVRLEAVRRKILDKNLDKPETVAPN